MKWHELNLDAGTWHVPGANGGQACTIALISEAIDLLKLRERRKINGYVFAVDGKPGQGATLSNGDGERLMLAAERLQAAAVATEYSRVKRLLLADVAKAGSDPGWGMRKARLALRIAKSSGLNGLKTYLLSRASTESYADPRSFCLWTNRRLQAVAQLHVSPGSSRYKAGHTPKRGSIAFASRSMASIAATRITASGARMSSGPILSCITRWPPVLDTFFQRFS